MSNRIQSNLLLNRECEINAIFCNTPYQLITAINLARSGINFDLFLMDRFKNVDQYARVLRSLQIFKEVKVLLDEEIFVNSLPRVIPPKIQLAMSYFRISSIAKRIVQEEVIYKNIYVSSKSIIPRLYYLYTKKQHFSTGLIFYDDGIGSYTNANTYDVTKGDSILRFLLFGNKTLGKDAPLFLYNPELYVMLNNNDRKTYSLPPINKQNTRDIINKVFDFDRDLNINQKVVILDTIKSNLPQDIREKLICLYKIIIDEFESNVVVKKHPRDKDVPLPNVAYYEHMGIPFELICLNCDIDEKLLVTMSSTSVILPKLLTGQEPHVIVLGGLLNILNSKDIMLYNQVKNRYRDSEKFCIPANYNELNEFLKKMKNDF